MATKTISITEEAYERLAARKEGKESFSEVINKLAGNNSWLDLVGVFSKKEAAELKKSREELNKRIQKDLDRVAARLR